MPTFHITSPDGHTYEVNAPDGATEQDALAHVQQSLAAPTQPQAQPVQAPTQALPQQQNIRHTGFAGQVGDAFSGASAPAPVHVPTGAELGQQYSDVAGGALTGAIAGLPGIPGDIEGVGRLLLNKAGAPVSRETTLPTSSDIGNAIAGQPSSAEASQGRFLGSLLSPSVATKAASLVSKGVGATGNLAAHALGSTTGAGGASIKEAFSAGREGGTASQAFLDQMRGNAPVAEVVQTAKEAVAQMRAAKNEAYKAGIGSTIKGDPQVLDFAPIDKAVNDVAGVGSFQGKSLSSGADKVRLKIQAVVDDWRNSDPATFHTPEGLDALKQKIGNLGYEEDLKDVAKPNSPGKAILDAAYNAVKGQIINQAPGYAQVMRDYMNASDELRNVEGSFSLGKNATTDTSLRKLQSILRNNANTNYGQRVQMGQTLADQGDGSLMPALAGQALSSMTPRGLQGAGAGIGGLAALGTGNGAALPLLALTSPRAVGETAYAAGKLLGNTAKKAAVSSGNANVASTASLGINPKLLGLLSPQVLAQLLLQPQTASQ